MHALDHSSKPALTSGSRLVVLDTNVVLDWLMFDDPHGLAWGGAVGSGRLAWIATDAMRAEFAHVLARGLATARGADIPTLLDAWDRHAMPASEAPASNLVCADPDDQKFLDLALHAGAAWLVTRDRELLRLRARALPRGVCILKPDETARDTRLCTLLQA